MQAYYTHLMRLLEEAYFQSNICTQRSLWLRYSNYGKHRNWIEWLHFELPNESIWFWWHQNYMLTNKDSYFEWSHNFRIFIFQRLNFPILLLKNDVLEQKSNFFFFKVRSSSSWILSYVKRFTTSFQICFICIM